MRLSKKYLVRLLQLVKVDPRHQHSHPIFSFFSNFWREIYLNMKLFCDSKGFKWKFSRVFSNFPSEFSQNFIKFSEWIFSNFPNEFSQIFQMNFLKFSKWIFSNFPNEFSQIFRMNFHRFSQIFRVNFHRFFLIWVFTGKFYEDL